MLDTFATASHGGCARDEPTTQAFLKTPAFNRTSTVITALSAPRRSLSDPVLLAAKELGFRPRCLMIGMTVDVRAAAGRRRWRSLRLPATRNCSITAPISSWEYSDLALFLG
jgi:hypothetical protein